MKSLLNPRWLLLVNTLPVAILFFLMISKYQIVKSLLEEQETTYWFSFGFVLFGLAIMNLIYTGLLLIRKQKVSPFYGLVALLTYIPYIYIYSFHIEMIMPRRVPEWLFGSEGFLYVGTFLMPTLAYALLIIVQHFTPRDEDHKAGLNFFFALLIPFSWYFFATTLLPLWQPVHTEFGQHAMIVLIIAGTVLFLFFLIRLIYILSLKRIEIFRKYQLWWKIPISIIFPLLGLALNNGDLRQGGFLGENVFGNFNHFAFYGLAVVNGIVLCLPNLDRESYRLGLFIARMATFAYTLYFFMAFLPFLPLAVLAIIAAGLGFLMLTPLALFVIHIAELSADYKYLQSRLSQSALRTISIVALMILPLAITFTYMNHRRHLHRALDFVYHPDFQQDDSHINRKALANTLKTINEHKDRNRSFDLGFKTPYLSSFYNWLVLDNLMLSNTKIQQLEQVFFGEGSIQVASEFINNEKVEITDLQTRSEWDEKEQLWRSWIDLEISNLQENSWRTEYATRIQLPEACWISDYYLYVGDRKEMGMLTEKKSALWVFSQIKNENRDPGLLHYISGNVVAFRVFPFAHKEVRKTGIEFMHRVPVEIKLDDRVVALGTQTEKITKPTVLPEGVFYLNETKLRQLDTIFRRPYYHFMLDVSQIDEAEWRRYQLEMQTVVQEGRLDHTEAKVTLVGTASSTFKLQGGWAGQWNPNKSPEGFNLDRAIRKALVENYLENNLSYPVFMVLSPTPFQNLIDKDFGDLDFTFPEGDDFYFLMPNGNWTRHHMASSPQDIEEIINPSTIKGNPVLAYPNQQNASHYFPIGQQNAWGISADYAAGYDETLDSRSWAAALILAANWRWQQLYPERSDEIWRPSVQASFDAHILSPVTALIVVENEAQKAALLQKQTQMLKGKASLDAGEDAARMSEPNLYLLFLLVSLILIWHQKRKRIKIERREGY